MKPLETIKKDSHYYILRIVMVGVFSAIAVVLVYLLHLPIFPAVSFLEYDMADVPIIMITLLYGPTAGFLMTVVVSVVQGLTVSASSGLIGIMMHILATGGYVLVAGNIYKRKKTLGGEVLSLGSGAATMVCTMILWNIFFTPIFMGAPREAVFQLMPLIILFNVIKAGGNSLLAYFAFKIMQQIMKKIKI
ncbi:MAG: ECF transporter S component [Oscillospiraceae bacterium]|nr:ECF transporter S component [Oscillospiraceae bacterium]